MGLRADPIGGGQFKQAVQQIIEAESQPIKSLQARKAKDDARLKLFQEFKTKFSGLDKVLSDFSTFRKFRELKADLGDGANIISLTLDKEKAEPGQYTMQVDELAARTSTISNGFTDANDPGLGMGFITMNLQNGDSTEIYVDDKNSSLYGIASLINREPNSPVQASVIKDDSTPDTPWKLMFTGKKDGATNQIDFPDFYFLDGAEEFYIDDDREAKNAQITLDGFPIELQSNDTTDFLPGVNIHLKQAKPDQPFTITITEDFQKISGKVKGLVDQINQILQFITKQNSIDEHTDTSSSFAGDTSLQSIEYQIRNVLQKGFPTNAEGSDRTAILHLSDLGVEFEKTGQLTFKEDKFNHTLEKNFDAISQSIIGPNGFVSQLRVLFDNYMRGGTGTLSVKEQALRARIKTVDDQIDQKTRNLEKKKQDVVAQFARLEGTLGNLQRQQQYLSASLPSGGGGNLVSQLLG